MRLAFCVIQGGDQSALVQQRREDFALRQTGAIRCVKRNSVTVSLRQKIRDKRGRLAPVSAQGHHVRLAQRGNDVRLIQHPILVNFAGHAPVRRDIHKHPLPLHQRLLDGLLAERLPRDGLSGILRRSVRRRVKQPARLIPAERRQRDNHEPEQR